MTNTPGEERPSAMVVSTGGYERGRYNAWGSQPKAHGVELGVVETRLIDLTMHFAAPIFYQEGDARTHTAVAVLLVVPGAGPISICADMMDGEPILSEAMDQLITMEGKLSLIARQDADPEVIRAFVRERFPTTAKLSLYKDYERPTDA